MDCSGCGFTNRSHARFCVKCGYQMAAVPFRIFDVEYPQPAPGTDLTPLDPGTWVAGRFLVIEPEATSPPQSATPGAAAAQNIYRAEDRSVCPACSGDLTSIQLFCNHCGQDLTGANVAWAQVRLRETSASSESLQPANMIQIGERQYTLVAATAPAAPPVLRVLPAMEKKPETSLSSAATPGVTQGMARIVGDDDDSSISTRLLYGAAAGTGRVAASGGIYPAATGSLVALSLQVEHGPALVSPIALFSLAEMQSAPGNESKSLASAAQEHLVNQVLSGALLASVVAPALEGDALDADVVYAAIEEAFVEAQRCLKIRPSGITGLTAPKNAGTAAVQVALVLIVHGKLYVAQVGNAGTSLTAWDHRQLNPTNLVVLTQQDILPLRATGDPVATDQPNRSHETIGPFPLGIGQRVILASRKFWEAVAAPHIVEVLLSHREPQSAAAALAAELPEARVVVIELESFDGIA
ncbi:MAG: hypothetical protein EXR62_06770 [Chloroflexi bacterium]|nr:hypothetical protein [Chloroflexota bacterium]